jgi:large subunit ribosomal protein L18
MTSRDKRKIRIRSKISGTALRPRVVIFRSNKHLYLQAIDDVKMVTLASASTLKSDKDLAEKFAKDLASQKVTKIVFDRGGYQYHGKIKNIAEELRKAGLEF